MKLTRRQLRRLISERLGGGEEYKQPSFNPTIGPWAVMWRDLSEHKKYGHLMTQENKRIFKMAWDRAASSYDLNPERVGREMVSILALRQIDPSMRPTVSPPMTGNPEIDMVLRGRSPIAEANRAGKPAMKITRRQLRRIIKEELSRMTEAPSPLPPVAAGGQAAAQNPKLDKLYGLIATEHDKEWATGDHVDMEMVEDVWEAAGLTQDQLTALKTHEGLGQLEPKDRIDWELFQQAFKDKIK